MNAPLQEGPGIAQGSGEFSCYYSIEPGFEVRSSTRIVFDIELVATPPLDVAAARLEGIEW